MSFSRSSAAIIGVLAFLSSSSLAATFQVDTADDVSDANPGDGICAAASGGCSLRAAVEETNSLPGIDEVQLPEGEFPVAGLHVQDDLEWHGLGPEVSAVTVTGDLRLSNSRQNFFDLQLRGARRLDGEADMSFHRVRITKFQRFECFQARLAFEDSRFDHNRGPLYCFDGLVEIHRSQIHDNDSVGVNVPDSELLMTDTLILRNAGAGLSGSENNMRIERSLIADNGGAGIEGYGPNSLELIDSFVQGNREGGINNSGRFTILRSAIVGNQRETGCGGGIWTPGFFGGNAAVIASTVSGNRAPLGGGICLEFRYQEADTGPKLHVLGSTISANRADEGGGVATLPPDPNSFEVPQLSLEESILAGNEASESPDCAARIFDLNHSPRWSSALSHGWNLIGVVDGCEIDLQLTDVAGTGAAPVDPGLAELGDYGGSTPSHALLSDSSALDAVPQQECSESDFPFPDIADLNAQDQRGVARPQGIACDIGAFESEPPFGIEVDVQPHRRHNYVNLLSNGLLLVALSGSAGFDVLDVEAEYLRFGPAAASPNFVWPYPLDVDRDGYGDLLSFFRIPETGIELGDETACLAGLTRAGGRFEGCDEIKTFLAACGLGFELTLVLPPLLWLHRRLRSERCRPAHEVFHLRAGQELR